MSTVEVATEIRPFNIDITEEQIDDLRRRIAATRWPSRELVDDRSQGVQLATLRELARYWTTDYDFRRLEARLNALPYTNSCIDCQRENERTGQIRPGMEVNRWDKVDYKSLDDSDGDTDIRLSDFEMDLSETGR